MDAQVDEANRFLEHLVKGEPGTFQSFDDGPARRPLLARVFNGSLAQHATQLEALNRRGAGVFWAVNRTDLAGRRSENIIAVRALFVDLDGSPLQPVQNAAATPHAIVESSPGRWHAYWLVNDCPLDLFRSLQLSLASKFGGDQSVQDLPRVMRLPGFIHHKSSPFRSRLLSTTSSPPYCTGDLQRRLQLESAPGLYSPQEHIVPPREGAVVGPGWRHHHLLRTAARCNWSEVSREEALAIVRAENEKNCSPPKAQSEVEQLVADVYDRYAGQHGRDGIRVADGALAVASLLAATREKAARTATASEADCSNASSPAASHFHDVDLSSIETFLPVPQKWFWQDYLPAGHVTLLAGHGGVGKSTFALMLAVSIATGRSFMGRGVEPARVLFFSAEDPAPLVMARLVKICELMEIPAGSLAANFKLLDASDFDPSLFSEHYDRGVRRGVRTPTYEALSSYIKEHEIDVVIIDNASDVFEGDEINRAMVRAFIRQLVGLVRDRDGAALLLGHVDKQTSRERRGSENGEGYSGSTAWHNSVRSRLFLVDIEADRLDLIHQKSNLGTRQPTLSMVWHRDGLPELLGTDGHPTPADIQRAQCGPADAMVVLRLLSEYESRDEFASPSRASPTNAYRLIGSELPRGFGRAKLDTVIRGAQRDGLLEVRVYRTVQRKDRERWALTSAGRKLIEVSSAAPSAPTAQSG